MEIQQLKNLYLNKILKHINKVNNELKLYNQCKEQTGGSDSTFDDTSNLNIQLVTVLNNNVSKLRSLNVEKKQIIDTLKLELVEKSTKLEQVEKELESTRRDLEATKKELEANRGSNIDKHAQLNAQVTELNTLVLNLNIEIDKLNSEIGKLNSEIGKLTNQVTKLTKSNEYKDAKLVELGNAKSQLDSQILTILKARIEDIIKNNTKLIESNNKYIRELVTKINTMKQNMGLSDLINYTDYMIDMNDIPQISDTVDTQKLIDLTMQLNTYFTTKLEVTDHNIRGLQQIQQADDDAMILYINQINGDNDE